MSGYYFYNLAYTDRAEVGALGKEATRTDVPYIYIYIYFPHSGGDCTEPEPHPSQAHKGFVYQFLIY